MSTRQTSDIIQLMRSKEERQKALERDGYKCRICGRGIRDGFDIEVHHHKKMGMGGRKLNDVESNMVSLCRQCHSLIESHKWKIMSLEPFIVETSSGEDVISFFRG